MADLQNDVVNIDEKIKQIEAKIKNPEKITHDHRKVFELTKFAN